MTTTTKEKYKYIRGAFLTWLRTSADIKTLTNFNISSNISVLARTGDEVVTRPFLDVAIVPAPPPIEDVDTWYETRFLCTAYDDDPLVTSDIIGAVENLAKQSGMIDAAFSDAYVKSLGIRSAGLRSLMEATGDPTGAIYRSAVDIDVRWREVT